MAETYAKIRVDNGRRRIEVNDAGECIEVAVDTGFLERLQSFHDWLGEKRQEIEGKEMVETAAIAQTYRESMEKVDALFGQNACRKVFGEGIIPDWDMITDFLNQMMPILEKMIDERQKKLTSKYNRSRRGGKK